MKLSRIINASVFGSALLMLAGCAGKADKVLSDADTTAQQATEAVENVTEIPAVTVIKSGEQLPAMNGKPQILDFNATWCGPCKRFAPNFDMIAEQYRDRAAFFSIDVDENPELAAQYNIESIPTIVYIQPDGSYSTTMGYMDAADFKAAVDSFLNK